ncbi:MAG: DUF1475 family protein [Bacillota bacterium]
MKKVKLFAILGILAMGTVLIYGFTAGDFFEDGSVIMNNPWGIVSLVDLYVGFILFSLWIIYRETAIINTVIWVILMMVFGWFIGAIYIYYVAYTSKGDKEIFFHGQKNLGD